MGLSWVSRDKERRQKMKQDQPKDNEKAPLYLNESERVSAIRNQFIKMVAHGGCPAMCKIKVWAQLKNAIIREAFAKAHMPVPDFVLEHFGK